jgi:hypothetical protein
MIIVIDKIVGLKYVKLLPPSLHYGKACMLFLLAPTGLWSMALIPVGGDGGKVPNEWVVLPAGRHGHVYFICHLSIIFIKNF